MFTNESNRDIKPRATLKVGDLAIIYGCMNTPFWKTLFHKPRSVFFLLCIKQYLRYNRAMMAFQLWSVFRYKPGYQTMGILTIVASLCFLLSFNSTHVPALLKPLAMFAVPVLLFYKTPEELYQLTVVDVESQFLLAYTALFTGTSLIHLITIWVKGNSSITKRGESWMVLGLSQFMKVNEFVVCGIVEPLIAMGIGLAAWKWAGDIHFAVFMWVVALAEATQQILDKSLQAHTESILRA